MSVKMADKLLIAVCIALFPWVKANPTGCVEKPGNLDSTIPTQCTYGSFTTPLSHSSFTTLSWQRLEFVEYQSSFQSSQFSGFSSASTSGFSSHFPHTITIKCKSGISTFSFGANAFSQFPNAQEVAIINCPITSFPASVFNGLTLSKLTIQGGKITSINADTFTGLTISKMNITAEESGIIIRDCPITGTLPDGLFASLPSLEYLILERTSLSYIAPTTFTNLTSLHYLSLANNALTNITSGIFDELRALTEVNMEGNNWACSCDNLWFLDYSINQNLRLSGGPLCDTPTEYNYKKATKYWKEVCPTLNACGHNLGVVMGPATCVLMHDVISYGIVVITVIMSTIALIIICKVRKDLKDVQNRLKNKRATSWGRVQEMMKKKEAGGVGASQKPPFPTKAGWE
ncbi:SLIT and NTRK-like protein 2 [Saccostrea cucullata]|uniref:SLIT and NTRK-like protein 2 n=1 Tax=Saccostrea cuccullata TaxID=36930 RepID=UPI002ED5FC74